MLAAMEAMDAFSENFVHKRLAGALVGFAAGGPIGGIGGFVTGGTPQERTNLADPRTFAQCQGGFTRNAQGQCERVGIIGEVQRLLPGGATGFQENGFGDGFGAAVMGRFGPALVPMSRPSTTLRCPRGSKLGKDNLCYDHIAKRDRKWNPGTKPMLTGGQVNTLRRARRIEDRLKKLGVPIHVHKKRSTRKLLR